MKRLLAMLFACVCLVSMSFDAPLSGNDGVQPLLLDDVPLMADVFKCDGRPADSVQECRAWDLYCGHKMCGLNPEGSVCACGGVITDPLDAKEH